MKIFIKSLEFTKLSLYLHNKPINIILMTTFFEMMRKLEIYGKINVSILDIREFLEFLRRNSVRVRTIAKDGYNEVSLL